MQIGDLTSASTPLDQSDQLLVVQSGITKKTTVGQVSAAGANGSGVPGASVNDALDYLLGLISGLSFTTSFAGVIHNVTNGTFIISIKTPFGGTIQETIVKTDSGSCRATVKVNTTAVGGSAHVCTPTEEAITRSTNNTFVAGDDIVIEVSDTLAASKLSYTIKYLRVL